MILLACALCTAFESQRMEYVEPLLNRTIQTHCFANKLAERGVSDYWINQIQGADTKLSMYFYRDTSSTVGWTYLWDSKVHLNRKFHDKYNLCQTASNIAHELTHTLGYAHPGSFVGGKQIQVDGYSFFAASNDVAYNVNYAFETCCPTQHPIIE